jgi:hypothetical protein
MEEMNSDLRDSLHKIFCKIADLFDPAIFTLLTGVGPGFFRFLRSRGIKAGDNLVVLSSKDHYSCDSEELKNVRILINLRKLNLIKHLDIFLGALVRILPPNTSFIGYFSDETPVSRHEVRNLLWKNGFKTIAMKEINGHTYFISQNMDSI